MLSSHAPVCLEREPASLPASSNFLAKLSLKSFLPAPKSGFRSQQQPSRSIQEVIQLRGFARKNDDGRNPDRRLANRSTPQVARAADNVGCEPPQIPSIKAQSLQQLRSCDLRTRFEPAKATFSCSSFLRKSGHGIAAKKTAVSRISKICRADDSMTSANAIAFSRRGCPVRC